MTKDEQPSTLKLMLGATGVVFGDIGTSPLYAFRESFTGEHKLPIDPFHIHGVLSMLVWALILVVTVKYVLITMRADNRGEGGSFALLALARRVAKGSQALPLIAGAALIAAALFYGDAVITPAVSIMSAVEGLKLLDPGFADYVIPVTLVIVAGLFAVQRFGTGVVGLIFGPVMVLWFLTLAGLGAWRIVENPEVLVAVNPYYAAHFLLDDPIRAFFTLGAVVLAVTGAEALYADMGHFGRKAIARAWLILALPALLLCYAGQAALVLADPAAIENPFYRLAPAGLLIPLLALSTVATVIASQSIISGAFSITQQAVQLGYMPRIDVHYTSTTERGQVYAPLVNLLLFAAVVALVVTFGSSSALAAAYGLAVTGTMVLTSFMIGFVAFRIWRWNPLWAAPLFAVLVALDLVLFAAAATKFLSGGWMPIALAAVLVLVFVTWRGGADRLRAKIAEEAEPVEDFVAGLGDVRRVPATAVYLTASYDKTPTALIDNLEFNLVVHERVVIATIETTLDPRIAGKDRLQTVDLGKGFTRALLRYGFAESPNVPRDLKPVLGEAPARAPGKPGAVVYFLSRQTLVTAKGHSPRAWRDRTFSLMARAAERPMRFFKLPVDRVVEIGSQVKL